MISNQAIETLFEQGPANQSTPKKPDFSRVREAADKTRNRITHAFDGSVKVRATMKRDHSAA